MKEFVGGTLEKRNQKLFDKLVPGSGASETVEGELIRAINRIVYRLAAIMMVINFGKGMVLKQQVLLTHF